ncbi:MAG: hypothetical protein AB7S39_10160 [Gemmatimonadales bacterium]
MKVQTRRVLAALMNPRAKEETAREHVRNAIQVLSNLLDFGLLEPAGRQQLRTAIERCWRALREIEKGNP